MDKKTARDMGDEFPDILVGEELPRGDDAWKPVDELGTVVEQADDFTDTWVDGED